MRTVGLFVALGLVTLPTVADARLIARDWFSPEDRRSALQAVVRCEVAARRANRRDCQGSFGGVAFRIASSGAGEITERSGRTWLVSIDRDPVQQTARCRLDGHILAVVFDDHQTVVTIGLRPRPTTRMALRFDDAPAAQESEGGWSGAEADPIFRRMLDGGELFLSWRSSPRTGRQEGRVDLAQFAAVANLAMEICEREVELP